jgi:hypothetical protein
VALRAANARWSLDGFLDAIGSQRRMGYRLCRRIISAVRRRLDARKCGCGMEVPSRETARRRRLGIFVGCP